MIPQLPTNYDLGICPPDGEIHWAVQKLKRTSAQVSVGYARKTCNA
jgi:hypothetical protein